MKLTLRPEWRLRPLSSFIGFLDLKTGVTVALLFAVSRLECELLSSPSRTDTRGVSQLLNKVAGVYGLIAVLTGAGGSVAQLSLYMYSVIGLIALIWGLKAIIHVCYPLDPFVLSLTSLSPPCRRMQSNPCTLLICSSRTICFLRHGSCSSPLFGGSTPRMTAESK